MDASRLKKRDPLALTLLVEAGRQAGNILLVCMYIFMDEEEEGEKNKGEQSVKPSAADIHPPPRSYLHRMRARACR